MDEVLVLLRPQAQLSAHALLARAPLRGLPAQIFGSKVLIAPLSEEQCQLLERLPEVAGTFPGAVPPSQPRPNDLTGQLAIDAWNARHERGADKLRVGEGVAWDDPRFEREGRPHDDDTG